MLPRDPSSAAVRQNSSARSNAPTPGVVRDRSRPSMTTPPLVSVIIPCYRAGRYVRETLEAVRAQTHPHWEILLCEDGVLDDTGAQVAAFATTTSNAVRTFQNPTNLGVSRTRNRLIDEARGAYLAFVDA